MCTSISCHLLLSHVALIVQRPIVVKLSRGRSVGPHVRLSVCPVHCGRTADQIRMPFGIISRTGPCIRQVVGSGDRSMGRGTFWGEFGAHHCNQWGLYGVHVRQRRDAALFPNYFGRTSCSSPVRIYVCVQLRHTIQHRTVLIILPLILQTAARFTLRLTITETATDGMQSDLLTLTDQIIIM